MDEEMSRKEKDLMRNIFVATGGTIHSSSNKTYSHLRRNSIFYHISDNTLTFIKRQYPSQFEQFLELWGTWKDVRPSYKQLHFRERIIQKTRNFKDTTGRQITPTIEICLLIFVGLGPKLTKEFGGMPRRIPKYFIHQTIQYPGKYSKR